jgi:serine/threonine protein phosphatase PrpC
MGTLAVARAIGYDFHHSKQLIDIFFRDRDFKQPFNKGEADFVSAEPAVTKFQLTDENDFIILSCDGLW